MLCNRFVFNSQILLYFIILSYILLYLIILERGIFWNGILLTGIFSFGILRQGIFCHETDYAWKTKKLKNENKKSMKHNSQTVENIK